MERRDFLQLGFGIAVGAAGGFRWVTSAAQPQLGDSGRPIGLIPGLLLRIPIDGPVGVRGVVVLELRQQGATLTTHAHNFTAGETLEVPTPVPAQGSHYGQFEVWALLPGTDATPRMLGGYALRPLRFGC